MIHQRIMIVEGNLHLPRNSGHQTLSTKKSDTFAHAVSPVPRRAGFFENFVTLMGGQV